MELLTPGAMVNARVRAVLKNGLLLSFLTYFTGIVSSPGALTLSFSVFARASKFSWLMVIDLLALVYFDLFCLGGHISS